MPAVRRGVVGGTILPRHVVRLASRTSAGRPRRCPGGHGSTPRCPPHRQIQPTASASGGQAGSPRLPHAIAGIATIKEKVATLPMQRTSSRRCLTRQSDDEADHQEHDDVADEDQHGRPTAGRRRGPRVRSSRRRSRVGPRPGRGSSPAPTPVRSCARSVPSTQSVATTSPNSTTPASVVSGSTIRTKNTGMSAIRMHESRFGTVRIADWIHRCGLRRPFHAVGPAGFEPATF